MNRTESGRCCKWVSWHQSANKQWKQSTQENQPSTPSTNSIIFHDFLPIVNDLHHTDARLSTSGWFFGRRDPRSQCGAGRIPSIDVQCCPRIKLIYLHWTLRSRNQTSMSHINYMYYIILYHPIISTIFSNHSPWFPYTFHYFPMPIGPLDAKLQALQCRSTTNIFWPRASPMVRSCDGWPANIWSDSQDGDSPIPEESTVR